MFNKPELFGDMGSHNDFFKMEIYLIHNIMLVSGVLHRDLTFAYIMM